MINQLINNQLPANYVRYADLTSAEAQDLINSLVHAYCTNRKLSIPFYADNYSSHTQFNKFLYAMSKAGFVESSINPKRKWGEFSLVESKLLQHFTSAELTQYRMKNRSRKYLQSTKVVTKPDNLVALPSGVQESGLKRPGMAKAAKHEYKYDTAMIGKYYDAILLNLVKSIDKMKNKGSMFEDPVNYKVIATDILNYHLFNEGKLFNSGYNISDSRGRAIFAVLSKVFNFISSKDARSMLVVPNGKYIELSDTQALDDIYLFIAELIGTPASSWDEKKLIGADCYATRDLHDLDLTDEHDRAELHENIWLERIYTKLDTLHEVGYVYWDVPLEIDFTALTKCY